MAMGEWLGVPYGRVHAINLHARGRSLPFQYSLPFLSLLEVHRQSQAAGISKSSALAVLSGIEGSHPPMAHGAGGRRRPAPSRLADLPSSVPSTSAGRPRHERPAPVLPASATSPVPAVGDAAAESSLPKRARKERGPNWSPEEVLILIQAKRDLYLEELEATDPRHLMNTDTSKWERIANDLQLAGYSTFMRDSDACKTKWHQIFPDYKKIADFFGSTGRDIPEYWQMSALAKKADNLPRQFARSFFDAIHEWNGSRPVIQPPHARDLLSPGDSNFRAQSAAAAKEDHEAHDSETDPYDVLPAPQQQAPMTTEETGGARSPMPMAHSPSLPVQPCPSVTGQASRGVRSFPPNAIIHNVSSLAATSSAGTLRFGSTAVRRKKVAGHTVIAEATKATCPMMASQMQGIADASLAVERTKIEVLQRLFTQQMNYQRDRDNNLHVSAAATHENERLSIQKQGELVACLAQLTQVLAKSLTRGSSVEGNSNLNTGRPTRPDPTPPILSPTAAAVPAAAQTDVGVSKPTDADSNYLPAADDSNFM